MDLVQLWWIIRCLFSSSPGTKQDADRKFFYTAFITSEPANLTMPDTADPAETLGLIKGLAEVVKSQHSAHKAEQEAHLKAMKVTNEHISNLIATVEGLSKQIPKSTATNNQGLRLPNLILPKYMGKQPLEHFINQMESLLHSSGVPFKFWTTYFKQQCQKDSQAYNALAEAETSFAAILGSDTSKTTEDQYRKHYEHCIKTLKEKCGIPRDQQIRELLSVYHTMTQQPNESVADFAHRLSETQHELDKLIPGIHKTARKEIELIFAFVNKLCSEISKELVCREFKFDKLQEIIKAAQRYKHHVTLISVTRNISKPISKVQTEVFITDNNYKPPGRYSINQQCNRSFNKSNVASNDLSSN